MNIYIYLEPQAKSIDGDRGHPRIYFNKSFVYRWESREKDEEGLVPHPQSTQHPHCHWRHEIMGSDLSAAT